MMTEPATTSVAYMPATRARISWLNTVTAAVSAAVVTIVVTTVVLAATPHVRGLGFYTELRFAVLAPLCLAAGVLSAILYRSLRMHFARPRTLLAALLSVLALAILSWLQARGPEGLALTATPMIGSCIATLVWLVPKRSERLLHSRVSVIATCFFGALELAGVVAAHATEVEQAPDFEIPQQLFAGEHKRIVLKSGARIHYVDEGEGETLLFLHGNPSWSFQWRGLIAGLRGSARCIALDYPGFGLSRAPANYGFTPDEQSQIVEEFVDALGLHEVTLVMQDWGGPIGLGFAVRRPELVKRVILGSTWAWQTSTSEARGKFSVIAGGPLGEFLQVNFNAFAKLGIQHGIVKTLPAAELALYLRPFQPLKNRGIAAFYPGQITQAKTYFQQVQRALPKLVQTPALIFWALQDQGFPPSDLSHFQKLFPHQKTIELPTANHFFFEDHLQQMLPEIKHFIH
jgi:pimeloyl-ACP methyl ester carboxylesterase